MNLIEIINNFIDFFYGLNYTFGIIIPYIKELLKKKKNKDKKKIDGFVLYRSSKDNSIDFKIGKVDAIENLCNSLSSFQDETQEEQQFRIESFSKEQYKYEDEESRKFTSNMYNKIMKEMCINFSYENFTKKIHDILNLCIKKTNFDYNTSIFLKFFPSNYLISTILKFYALEAFDALNKQETRPFSYKLLFNKIREQLIMYNEKSIYILSILAFLRQGDWNSKQKKKQSLELYEKLILEIDFKKESILFIFMKLFIESPITKKFKGYKDKNSFIKFFEDPEVQKWTNALFSKEYVYKPGKTFNKYSNGFNEEIKTEITEHLLRLNINFEYKELVLFSLTQYSEYVYSCNILDNNKSFLNLSTIKNLNKRTRKKNKFKYGYFELFCVKFFKFLTTFIKNSMKILIKYDLIFTKKNNNNNTKNIKDNTKKKLKLNNIIISNKFKTLNFDKIFLWLGVSTSSRFGIYGITKSILMLIEPKDYNNEGYGGLLKKTIKPTLIKKPKVDSQSTTYATAIIDSINILQKKPYKMHDAFNYYYQYDYNYKIQLFKKKINSLYYLMYHNNDFDDDIFFFALTNFNLDKCIAYANQYILEVREENANYDNVVKITAHFFNQLRKSYKKKNININSISKFIELYIKNQKNFQSLKEDYFSFVLLLEDYVILKFLKNYNKELWTASAYDYRGRNYPIAYNISRSTNYKHFLVNSIRTKCGARSKLVIESYLIVLFNKTSLKKKFTNFYKYMHFINSKNILHQLKCFNISNIHSEIFGILKNNNCLEIFNQQDVFFYIYFHEYLIVLLGFPTNINIDIDHVNSGPCYMSTLVGDSYILNLCNVCTNSKKKDLYTEVSVQIYRYINKKKIKKIITTFNNKKNKNKISQNILKYTSLLTPKLLLDRSVGKSLIQPRLYGSTYKSFRETLTKKKNKLIQEITKLKNQIIKEKNKSNKKNKLKILKTLIILRNIDNYNYNLNLFIKNYLHENKNKKLIKLLDKYNNNENLLKDLLKNYLYDKLNKNYLLKQELYFNYNTNIKKKLELLIKITIKQFKNKLIRVLNLENKKTITNFLKENYENKKNKDFSEITRLIWFVSNKVEASRIITISTKKLKQLLQYILTKIKSNETFKFITQDHFIILYSFKKKEILRTIVPDFIHSLDGLNIRLLMLSINGILDKNKNNIPEPSHDGSRGHPNNISLNKKLHIIAYAYAFSIDIVTEDYFIKTVINDIDISKKRAKLIYKELSNALSSYNNIKETNYLKDLNIKTNNYEECLKIIHPIIYYNFIYSNKDLLDKPALIEIGQFLIELRLTYDSIENLTFENIYLNSSKMFIIKA